MKKFMRENSLSLFFGVILLAALAGQSVAGQRVYNADAAEHGEKTISWARYLVTPEFGGDLLENWQSEFLQFSLYIMATVWFLQRGSNESKALDDAGLESDEQQRVGEHAERTSPRLGEGRRHAPMGVLPLALPCHDDDLPALVVRPVAERLARLQQRPGEHRSAHIGYLDYLVDADFWNRTLQNWQSEFLAVGAMAVFTIYLRQRGSPESKPVGAPHGETASSG